MLAAVSSLHSSQQPGVGLFFHESAGKIKVKTIVSGGSAERDGRIQVGDTLIAIDGVDVRGQSQAAPFFKNLITGPEGSTVRLKMLRGEASSAFGYELHLFRGTPEYFAGLEQERRNEEALSELKQALAEEQQVAERGGSHQNASCSLNVRSASGATKTRRCFTPTHTHTREKARCSPTRASGCATGPSAAPAPAPVPEAPVPTRPSHPLSANYN